MHRDRHQVENQPPPLESYNLYQQDAALREGLKREGGGWAEERASGFGEICGRPEVIALGAEANRNPPVLITHDRFGHRVDRVDFHPAWHELMKLGVEAEAHALPWRDPKPGAHVARATIHYLLDQVEAGVGCPITMTFAGVPALRANPEISKEWMPRLISNRYDPRFIPADQKDGCLIGMAMTEKQGGSDVRANTTRAIATDRDGEYLLAGHKWFCSAPMCDAFLTLAQTKAGITCFFVPRFLPDGSQNAFEIQRLKDKLGNRSNASSEIEYHDTLAMRIGDEGQGVPTIIEMVNHTRLDCVVGSAALMRQALAQATHHAAYRRAFGKRLIEQPLMQNVLADLALEVEAATALFLRLARAYDEGAAGDEGAQALARIATAAGKFWVCKRAPGMIGEALECHGGNGYVEESILPRLYREAPLSSIWEGSGNVMALDVLRAMSREPETVVAFFDEVDSARGGDKRLDAWIDSLKRDLEDDANLEPRARDIVSRMALALQASLLVRHHDTTISDAFCAARLGEAKNAIYGTLPGDVDREAIIERARPKIG